jgi:2-dehydropantoate 2-reductase
MSQPRHTVVGAGSVGLVLGALLARSGVPTLFVTRREEAARRLADAGVQVADPATGERWRAAVDATTRPTGEQVGEGPVFLCVRGPDTAAAARTIAEAAPGATLVSVQNDVDNESLLARSFERVIGAVWRQTCTRTAPDAVMATGRTRMVIGRWPRGAGPEVESLAAVLRGAGIDVGVSERIEEDLWLKLCVNLMSAPNALVRRPDHTTRAFVELKARLLEEAREALAAEGVRARSCDGRDRSLDDEIAWQRESLARGSSARDLPIYNHVWTGLRGSVWQGLEELTPLEADDYHRRILELAARHGLDAPVNARVLAALEDAVRRKTGPECVAAASLLGERPED